MINHKLTNRNEDNNLKNHLSEAPNNMIVLAMIMIFSFSLHYRRMVFLIIGAQLLI